MKLSVQNDDYLDAVKSGDTETARNMAAEKVKQDYCDKQRFRKNVSGIKNVDIHTSGLQKNLIPKWIST